MKIYVIGSLRNPRVPEVAREIRSWGHDAFDEWYAAGPEADDCWQKYSKERGHSYAEALKGRAAQHVFLFDLDNLMTSQAAVLVSPAGRSGYLELGFMIGRQRPGFILLEQEPERYDVMAAFARVCSGLPELKEALGAL